METFRYKNNTFIKRDSTFNRSNKNNVTLVLLSHNWQQTEGTDGHAG